MIEKNKIILFDGGKIYDKSTAILMIFGQCDFPWSLFKIFKIIPKFIRDFCYDFIGERRYKWFGKKQNCDLDLIDKINSRLNK